MGNQILVERKIEMIKLVRCGRRTQTRVTAQDYRCLRFTQQATLHWIHRFTRVSISLTRRCTQVISNGAQVSGLFKLSAPKSRGRVDLKPPNPHFWFLFILSVSPLSLSISNISNKRKKQQYDRFSSANFRPKRERSNLNGMLFDSNVVLFS
jgi:hypothetical protein